MTYKQQKHLKSSDFKRRCGVHPETFKQMVEILHPHLERRGKRGGQCKLSVEDQLLGCCTIENDDLGSSYKLPSLC